MNVIVGKYILCVLQARNNENLEYLDLQISSLVPEAIHT